MKRGGLEIQLNISTFLIQPLLLVRVQQRYVELAGMTRCWLTWMLIARYCGCKRSGMSEEAGLWTQQIQSVCPLKAMALPSGRTAFSQDVSFSAWGSREQQEAEETGSENPESIVLVVDSEVWEEERKSDSPEWRAEAWAHSAWSSGCWEWLSCSRSLTPTALLHPMASSLGPRASGEPAGIVGRSTWHWEVSGDVLPDWKGGWNTLTENLQRERETLKRNH